METSPPPPPPQHGTREHLDELSPLLNKPVTSNVGDSAAWKVTASCCGFLADSYDLFTIDLVVAALQLQYGEDVISAKAKSLIVSLMLVGVIVGQLSFGFVADWVGRKWAFVTTAGITIVGAILSACVQPSQDSWNLPLQLALCRLLLGIGVGGEYPLSATVTAEAAEDDPYTRGRMMALVISMQGFGMLLSSVVALIALSANASMEVVWRLLLAFGAVPSIIAFGFRWKMHESAVFEQSRKTTDGNSQRHKNWFTAIRQYWTTLLGTAGVWLLMNIFQYSLGSFKSTILLDIMPEGTGSQMIFNDAKFAAITSAFAIAGFAAGHIIILYFSRFTMQFWGFFAVAVVFFVVGGLSGANDVSGKVMLVFLGLMFFFLNAGPNISTFILPAESFPTRVRASCHGISAASGKVGAVIGTAVLPPCYEAFGMMTVYIACGIVALLAVIGTYFLTPRETVALSILDATIKEDK